MANKKIKNLFRIGIYGLLGLAFLGAGILYARFERGGLAETLSQDLQSQATVTEPTTVQQGTKPTMSREKIVDRITRLQEEIVQETNDPARALELRRELQYMREELSRLEQ